MTRPATSHASTFETVSRNQNGDEVVKATWTNIVRGV